MRINIEEWPDTNIVVAQASTVGEIQKTISLVITFTDDVTAASEYLCSLSLNFMTPVSDDSDDLDSIFTLDDVMYGKSVKDVIVKFICMYDTFNMFRMCDLSDPIAINFIDGTESLGDFMITDIIEQASKDPEFSYFFEIMRTADSEPPKTPRIVK